MCGLKADWGLYRFMTKLIKNDNNNKYFPAFYIHLIISPIQTYDLRIKKL